jgi:hypothetical protein
MTPITIPGFLYAKPAYDWEDGPDIIDRHRISFYAITPDVMQHQGFVLICPYTLQFEMPEGWDPRAQQVEALRAKKEELHREFAEAVMKIDQQINSLLALEAA